MPIVAKTQRWKYENLGRGGTGYLINDNQQARDARSACGQDYCESYPEMIDTAAALSPDVVVVSGGRNNVRADMDDLRSGVESFYQTLRAKMPDADIIVTSPVWDSSAEPKELDQIGEAVRESVERIGGRYLDIGDPFTGNPQYISEDGIHPNDAGYRILADAIDEKLAA